MKYFLWLLRIVVGVLFIFSGLVKANDPLGLSYKMEEFFEVLHMTFFSHYALAFSILMIGFELMAGVAILLGYAFRLFSFFTLLLIAFFTFLTAFALYSGKIKECGCFGDCIKISNEATFYKDVALLVMILILFVYRKRVQPLFSNNYIGTSLMILLTFFSFGMQWYVLEHLPVHDCLPYKVSNNISEKMQIPAGAIPDKYETVMIYEKDGVKKEFTMSNYPWQDSTWKFVDRKDKLISKGNAEAEIKDFAISDYQGGDHTKEILTTAGYTFVYFIKDPEHARTDNMDKLRKLYEMTVRLNIPFYAVYSCNEKTAKEFHAAQKLGDMPYYVVDVTVSKTAMRSNPGLMLLEQGTVRGKWSFCDYPKNIAFENKKLKIN
ncbi:MAG: BT_3928 family protein [Bacteroidota bacterium]